MRCEGGDTSTRTVWLGHEFVDKETQGHVRRVVISAAVMTAVLTAFMTTIVLSGMSHQHFGAHEVATALAVLTVGLLLPACGLVGAAKSSSPLMCCFCGTSLVFVLLHGLFLLLLGFALWQTDVSMQASCDTSCKGLGCGSSSSSCSCELDCQHRTDVLCCADFTEVCPLTSEGHSQPTMGCKELTANLAMANVLVIVVLLVLVAPGLALSTYAWYHGMMLWKRLFAGEQLVATGAVALSPARSVADEGEGEGDGAVTPDSPRVGPAE